VGQQRHAQELMLLNTACQYWQHHFTACMVNMTVLPGVGPGAVLLKTLLHICMHKCVYCLRHPMCSLLSTSSVLALPCCGSLASEICFLWLGGQLLPCSSLCGLAADRLCNTSKLGAASSAGTEQAVQAGQAGPIAAVWHGVGQVSRKSTHNSHPPKSPSSWDMQGTRSRAFGPPAAGWCLSGL
jgi:hypothetical protein